MQRRWIFPVDADHGAVARVRGELGLPGFLASLLVRRGFAEPAEADAYLNPKLRSLSAPELLPDAGKAVERLLAAIRGRERIVLYGDYDVDGITSLAILARVLKAFGAEVECFLPMREGEGYGLSAAGVGRCLEAHSPGLLVAVDCGTNSVREIGLLRARGVDVVVLDHHEPGPVRPDCTALVNPKAGPDFHYLCSAGVVFKIAHALVKASPVEGLDLRDFLDLVALATVADIVPLVGENRIFVSHGLKRMEHTRWAGLAALRDVAGVSTPVRVSDIGFRMDEDDAAAGTAVVAAGAAEADGRKDRVVRSAGLLQHNVRAAATAAAVAAARAAGRAVAAKAAGKVWPVQHGRRPQGKGIGRGAEERGGDLGAALDNELVDSQVDPVGRHARAAAHVEQAGGVDSQRRHRVEPGRRLEQRVVQRGERVPGKGLAAGLGPRVVPERQALTLAELQGQTKELQRAVGFLLATQRADGSWPAAGLAALPAGAPGSAARD